MGGMRRLSQFAREARLLDLPPLILVNQLTCIDRIALTINARDRAVQLLARVGRKIDIAVRSHSCCYLPRPMLPVFAESLNNPVNLAAALAAAPTPNLEALTGLCYICSLARLDIHHGRHHNHPSPPQTTCPLRRARQADRPSRPQPDRRGRRTARRVRGTDSQPGQRRSRRRRRNRRIG